MALRTGHGHGAGVPRVEVLPADELPRGAQGPAQASACEERRPDEASAFPGGPPEAVASGEVLSARDRLRSEKRVALDDLDAE
jgi:hypothetical protein